MLEHKCEVCGRMTRHSEKINGYKLCYKHFRQYKKYGKFLDNNPRTMYDKNEIIINGDVAYICLYDIKTQEEVARAIIDAEDVDKVKNFKWCMTTYGYAMNRNDNKYLHRFILGVDTTVDHINQNKLDNRKSNLRICNKSTNSMNSTKHKGIQHYEANGNRREFWTAYIKINGKATNIKRFYSEEEALYCRWFAERILFKEFAPDKEEPIISEERKKMIQDFTREKLTRVYNL